MEIHQSAVILLLILSVSSFTHGQPADIMPRYKKFLNQHVDPYMTVNDCTSKIENRVITGTDSGCKPVNSFIVANADTIKAVCGKGGTAIGGNLFESNNPFFVVKCTIKNNSKGTPKCEYRGNGFTRKIVLACQKGWPVHYER
ncbi:ribonuclease-like 3 [Ctenopharyngodon idella]|uniref:ribonuclease-like 3 n=1 Tax=Ctenopharyngodon idella TaxID=7959 RepID=UPI0022316E20|nr:ribonuclease-like 3 [Ctenopharyngodon idella]XP_051763510.1 ribonuclease-like 3 [Ctenopharyngodon idella]XP_051763511.1 ribonuclease-like 3 [Ctenopharyngodon idella]